MSHIKEMPAREAKNNFGELLDSAQRAPVRITRNGRGVAVMVSYEDYRHFEKIKEVLWGKQACETNLDPAETEAMLKRLREVQA